MSSKVIQLSSTVIGGCSRDEWVASKIFNRGVKEFEEGVALSDGLSWCASDWEKDHYIKGWRDAFTTFVKDWMSSSSSLRRGIKQ